MFEYAFMQNAFIVALLISIVCPLIGIFLVSAPLFHDRRRLIPCIPGRGRRRPPL